ncbi:MAG: ParB N-terminal domain-containing protein [Candidatus Kuenenbacteria bacterium]
MHHHLPNLKIVPIKNLLLHEMYDDKRVLRLKKEISKSGILINPPIVARINKTKIFVVLDGANRVTCMRSLGYSNIVVQVVNYLDQNQVQLEKWDHLICNLSNQYKSSILNIIKNSEFVKIKKDRNILIKKIKKEKLKEQLEFINNLFKQYKDKEFYRVMGKDIQEFQGKYKNIDFLIIYPKLKPEDIINITKNNLKVPSGITRHIIQNRAIGIDIDLNILKSSKFLVEKNKYLKQLINKRLGEHKIRYYKEPITIFND